MSSCLSFAHFRPLTLAGLFHRRLSSWLFPDQGASEAGASGATSLADTAKDVAETDYFYTTAQSCLTFVEESAASALAIALFPPETPASVRCVPSVAEGPMCAVALFSALTPQRPPQGIAMVSATPVAALTPVNETRMADMAEVRMRGRAACAPVSPPERATHPIGLVVSFPRPSRQSRP